MCSMVNLRVECWDNGPMESFFHTLPLRTEAQVARALTGFCCERTCSAPGPLHRTVTFVANVNINLYQRHHR